MYCPKCGTQNLEEIKFCRSCGANLSLVPQALTGQLPEERAVGHDAEGKPYDRHGRRIQRQPGIATGIQHIFMGTAFFIIAMILTFFTRQNWGLWLLIPAFGIAGKGISEIVAYKVSQTSAQATAPPARSTGPMPPRDDYTPLPTAPPSVTENTTRHLDATREQQPRDTR